ncbi:hypothetical protein L7F22_039063 [Adiantum nelumboides]|nr:hypothetical protein [Adiantum nelumboides]
MPSIPWHRRSPGLEEVTIDGTAEGATFATTSGDKSTSPSPPPPPVPVAAPQVSQSSQTQEDIQRLSPKASNANMGKQSGSNLDSQKNILGKLRVQIFGAHALTGKDRNGLSDPFFIINLPGAPPNSRDRHHYRRITPVRSKTLDPEWKDGEASFDWDITKEWLQADTTESEESIVAIDHATSSKSGTQTPAEHPLASSSNNLLSIPTTETITPATTQRPSNVRKISAATGRLLIAPVRMSARGAMATGRVVKRGGNSVRKNGRPRPLRLGKNQQMQNGHAPAGSATLGRGGKSEQHAVSAIEFVCWDKDKWSGNDYMGECSLLINDWIPEGKSADWTHSEPIAIPLVSTRRNAKVSGEVIVKIGFIPTSSQFESTDDLYVRLLEAHSRIAGLGIRSIPADQSVGTAGPTEAFVDDGLSSDSEEEEELQEELLSDDEDSRSVTSDEGDTATTETDDPYETDQSAANVPIHQKVPHHRHHHGKHRSSGQSSEAQKAEEQTVHTDSEAFSSSHAATEIQKQRRRFLPASLRKSRSYLHQDPMAGTATPISGTTSDVADEGSIGDASPSTSQRRKRRIGVRRRKRDTSQLDASTTKVGRKERRMKRREERQRRQDFAFKAEQGRDIIGIVQLEVKRAKDLPKWKNSLGTSFDMDAFVIVSFGQRIFRTRVVRHSLNPTWDEKLLFHVRRHEANYVTKLAIYDWDKLSSNDYVGETELHISDLVENAPKPNADTGLYSSDEVTQPEMTRFELPLIRREDGSTKNLGKHAPILTVQARFTPYAALRQRFWRQLIHQYDSNDSGTLSILEIMSMLDSLGSTLTPQTIEAWFSRFDKNGEEGDELTIDEAISALEAEIVKPNSQKRVVDQATAFGGLDSINASSLDSGNGAHTPSIESGLQGEMLTLTSSNDFAGPQAPSATEKELAAQGHTTTPATMDALQSSRGTFARQVTHDESKLSVFSTATSSSTSSTRIPGHSTDAFESSKDTSQSEEGQVERVIMLKSCPMCRMPRLSKKAEVDIVTHLAVCASQDWRRVDSMMVGNYVTAMQAHRKWVTKVISKISQGQYQLGANSANIIVQDRQTGEMLEEKMQVYVRLGIRLLYKGARSRMEGARIRRMLKNMSVKQGAKFNSPASAREIPHFIEFHSLNTSEVREPLDSFKTFNEFFYRKLKEDARPVDDAEDPNTLVSAADCRFMAFNTVEAATQIWIKGREFTIERLLGNGFLGSKHDLDSYRNGGGLSIFRLAPQDYHRFHCPADAVVGKITTIEGQYYTVNPMAIRSAIDVYGENVRVIVPFHSKEFGLFYCVCIGAMMVGSTIMSVKEGDHVKRGQEMGYFAFGGSTLVMVFEQGRVQFDEDLIQNSEKAIETLVRVGMRIGRNTNSVEQGVQVKIEADESQ